MAKRSPGGIQFENEVERQSQETARGLAEVIQALVIQELHDADEDLLWELFNRAQGPWLGGGWFWFLMRYCVVGDCEPIGRLSDFAKTFSDVSPSWRRLGNPPWLLKEQHDLFERDTYLLVFFFGGNYVLAYG